MIGRVTRDEYIAAVRSLIAEGERLELITDHAPALSTVPWEGAKLGYVSEIEPRAAGEWVITLEKAAAPIDQRQVLTAIAARAAELAPDEA